MLRATNLLGFNNKHEAAAPANISFVGSAVNNGDTVTSIALDVSSLSAGTLQQDDVIIVAINAADAANAGDYDVTCSGNNSGTATELCDIFADDNAETSLGVFYIVAGGTVDTTITCSVASGTPDAFAAIAFVFRGVDTTTPIDVTTTTSTGINTGIPTGVAITPTTSGAWPVGIASNGSNRGSTTLSSSNLSGGVSEVGVTTATSDAVVFMGYKTDWTSGAFTPTYSWSGTDSTAFAYCVATIALRPA